MTTITLWLLIVSSSNYRGASVPQVLERFATSADCQHVLESMPKGYENTARCVQAKVVK
jgi:hypothetical protein